jgi:hypothetical protein
MDQSAREFQIFRRKTAFKGDVGAKLHGVASDDSAGSK